MNALISLTLQLAALATPAQHHLEESAATQIVPSLTFAPEDPVWHAYDELLCDLLDRAVRDVDVSDLQPLARQLGLELVSTRTMVILRPLDDEARGAGMLALRRGPLETELFIAAPHAFTDLGVGRFATEVFSTSDIRGLYLVDEHAKSVFDSDPCVSPVSALELVTHSIYETMPGAWITQIHAHDLGDYAPMIVVSDAMASTSRHELEFAADRISRGLGGLDVRTTRFAPAYTVRDDVQSSVMRDSQRFLHLTLSYDMRKLTESRPDMSQALGEMLIEVAKPGRPEPSWVAGPWQNRPL